VLATLKGGKGISAILKSIEDKRADKWIGNSGDREVGIIET
jgi:hypothetical protein